MSGYTTAWPHSTYAACKTSAYTAGTAPGHWPNPNRHHRARRPRRAKATRCPAPRC